MGGGGDLEPQAPVLDISFHVKRVPAQIIWNKCYTKNVYSESQQFDTQVNVRCCSYTYVSIIIYYETPDI